MGAGGSCGGNDDDVRGYRAIFAGKTRDYEEDGCKEVRVNDNLSVLVAKYQGNYYATGGKCPHYGAPLGKGVFKDGRIKCPWHGACFDIRTGDIEDFPGIDDIPTYKVKVKGRGNVTVYINPKRLSHRVIRPMVRMHRMKDEFYLKHVVIFGAGPAGFTCAQTLRQQGFTGRITMISKDQYLPYDKPKLSKTAGVQWEDIKLRDQSFYDNHDITILLNTKIGRVDLSNHKLYLESNDHNEFISYDKIVIACGMKPRTYGPTVRGYDLKNILTCSTIEESQRISEMIPGKHVLIVGSSFVAMELASVIKDKVASLGILSRQEAPYGMVFGDATGKILLEFFLGKAKKAVFHAKDEVKYFEGNAKGEVKSVVTIKKKIIPCEIVILACGAVPNIDLFDAKQLKVHTLEKTIICNKYLETSCTHAYAAGDIANFPIAIGARDRISVGHWQVAQTHGRVVALNIIKPKSISVTSVIPFFWTNLCGVNLRYTGYGESYDQTLIYGYPEKMEFCTVYMRFRKIIAVLAVGCDPLAAQMALEFEDQENWDYEIPPCINVRFPEKPLNGDYFTGYRFDSDALNAYDLKRANLRPFRFRGKPYRRRSVNLVENLYDINKEPRVPTFAQRLNAMKKEQRIRRRLRSAQRKPDFTISRMRLNAIDPSPYPMADQYFYLPIPFNNDSPSLPDIMEQLKLEESLRPPPAPKIPSIRFNPVPITLNMQEAVNPTIDTLSPKSIIKKPKTTPLPVKSSNFLRIPGMVYPGDPINEPERTPLRSRRSRSRTR